jgi:hypothetical protein
MIKLKSISKSTLFGTRKPMENEYLAYLLIEAGTEY